MLKVELELNFGFIETISMNCPFYVKVTFPGLTIKKVSQSLIIPVSVWSSVF